MATASGRTSSRAPRRLTPREVEVLTLAAGGMTNAMAARTLGISIHAIKFHLASIFRKLEVANRTEAVAVFVASQAAVRPIEESRE